MGESVGEFRKYSVEDPVLTESQADVQYEAGKERVSCSVGKWVKGLCLEAMKMPMIAIAALGDDWGG